MLAIADQIFDQIENLRRDLQQHIAAAQLAPIGIERKIFETIKQSCSPSSRIDGIA